MLRSCASLVRIATTSSISDLVANKQCLHFHVPEARRTTHPKSSFTTRFFHENKYAYAKNVWLVWMTLCLLQLSRVYLRGWFTCTVKPWATELCRSADTVNSTYLLYEYVNISGTSRFTSRVQINVFLNGSFVYYFVANDTYLSDVCYTMIMIYVYVTLSQNVTVFIANTEWIRYAS